MNKERTRLQRTVGLIGSSLFSVNGMIGAGIFALPALLAASVGNFAPWLVLFGAVLILPIAAVFAALASRFDDHGGPVLYAEAAFGQFIGFQTGWMRYTSGVIAVAANTHVAFAYLAILFPILEQPTVKALAVGLFIIFCTLINLVGMRHSIRVLSMMTALKIIPLVMLVLLGLSKGDAHIGFSLPEFSELESVVLLTFYAFTAFENATYPAGEIKNPKRNIPLVLAASVLGVTAFYMLVVWSYLAISPNTSNESNALASAAASVLGSGAGIVISLAAFFSIGANVLTGGTVVPRLTFGLAQRDLLPKIFRRVSSRFETPDFSIAFFGISAFVLSQIAGFAALAIASTLSRLVMYLLCAAALPIIELRQEGRTSARHLLFATAAGLSAIWVAMQAAPSAFLGLATLLLIGGVLFLLTRSNADKELQ